MRNVTLAPARPFIVEGACPCRRNTRRSGRGNQSRVQRLVDLGIDRGQPAMDATKEIDLIERGTARRIAVHDRTVGVNEKSRGSDHRECPRCRRFRLAEIDHLAGANRTPNVRHDESHATTHVIIDHAARFVPQDAEIRAARRGFFQHGICSIDPALWLRPLAKNRPARNPS